MKEIRQMETDAMAMEKEDEVNETEQKESTDYAYVDRFVESLDEDEKAYLIEKLNAKSSETEIKENALDEKDFED